ncbi:MAG: dihydrofolate reductase [Bacteroidaceae bacterium]|nr:dihydrofolate reductase [Bacteroidaceae bacterium]
MLSLIVAIAQNNAIGRAGQLLYHLPNDLKRFKTLTTGHTIIMGHKTFESFPNGALPYRRNIVLSHNATLHLPGAEVFPTLADALAACQTDEEVFVIGGGSVYRQALPLADKLYITLIDDTPMDADTFFPLTDSREWQPVYTEHHATDNRHAYPYTFIDYIRCK